KNTFASFDRIADRFSITQNLNQVISMVWPQEDLRKAAEKGFVKLSAYSVDAFTMNQRLYKACEEYETRLNEPGFAAQESLTPGEKYFLDETMRDFRQSGLQLPAEQQIEIKKIRKELSGYESQFDQNISADLRKLPVARDELKGWEDS